jgi:long-chain acyl-CoA synthetase
MDLKAKEYSLTTLERPKKIHLTGAPFSIENDILTPTLKLKRHAAKKFYQEQIDKLYAEGGDASPLKQ